MDLYDVVKTCLHYDPETGLFTHTMRPRDMFTTDRNWKKWNTRFAGTLAGTIKENKWNGKFYKYIRLLDKDYMYHRIAWL